MRRYRKDDEGSRDAALRRHRSGARVFECVDRVVGTRGTRREPEHDAKAHAARWADLRAQIFGERAMADGAGLMTIETPERAEDAALDEKGVRGNLT